MPGRQAALHSCSGDQPAGAARDRPADSPAAVFWNEAREAIMVLPGESRFGQLIMESLRAYSAIALAPDRRDHLLVCETLTEFTAR